MYPGGPRLILHSDSPSARLQQHTQLRWRDICIAPCGYTVDPAGLYRIGGGTTRPSETFQLPRPSGDVVVDVQAGSTVKHWVGLGLMIGGVAAAAYGVAVWQLFNSIESNSSQSTQPEDVGRTFGVIFISVGAVLAAVGIPMWFSNTSVQIR